MNCISTDNQAECLELLKWLNVRREELNPIPPQMVSDAMVNLDGRHWLIITNDLNHGLKVHFVMDATSDEAWGVYDRVRQNVGQKNHRLLFKQTGVQTPAFAHHN